MVSFLYPRTVDVRRARTVATANGGTGIGDVGYSGEEDSTDPSDTQGELVVFTALPCSIQSDSPGRPRGSMLPQDATSHPRWKIMIPGGVVPKGQIRDRDILIDDENYRYEVIQAFWTPLGYSLSCLRLEA